MEFQGGGTIQGCSLCGPPLGPTSGSGGAFESDGVIWIPQGQILKAQTYSVLRQPSSGSWGGAPKTARQVQAAEAVGVENEEVETSGWLSIDWGKVVQGIDDLSVRIWSQVDRIDARSARRDQNRIALSRLQDGTDYMPLIVGGGLIAVALMVRKSRAQVVVPNGAFVAQ